MPGKRMAKENKAHPSYLRAYTDGKLQKLAAATLEMLRCCAICPRKCRVNRLEGEKGFCKTGREAVVYSWLPHHGEEPPVSGKNGSGAVFFSGCNMRCAYCQNYEFSQAIEGSSVTPGGLADIMLELQSSSCHNINFVTPTHVLPQIIEALLIAVPKGLRIPLVYNTGGYELPEVIKLLEGIVDIYLPDMRYGDNAAAEKYSSAPGYADLNQAAVAEMYRQAGNAQFDEREIIKKGLIIRHLVMPGGISGTEKVMKFIAGHISSDAYISLMSQYKPFHKATGIAEVSRRITAEEYEAAQELMHGYGLSNGWTQDAYGLDRFAGVNIKTAFK